MKVLVAEDDPVSRTLVVTYLEKWGFSVVPTVDGQEALAAYNEDESIQMAILDWMMPGMAGVEVCHAIRTMDRQPAAYVIMLTAKAAKEDLVQALDAGADDFVAKPFDASELKARISAGVRMVNLQTSLQSKVQELEEALTHVKQLQGILPICAWCKKIRDDSNYWSSVEEYVSHHSEAKFSHGICPDCLRERYPEEEPAP